MVVEKSKSRKSWTSARGSELQTETGKRHFRTEVVANVMILLGDRRKDGQQHDVEWKGDSDPDDDFAF